MFDILTTDRFDEWALSLSPVEQTKLYTCLNLLISEGHKLSRPYADTINNDYDTSIKNLKELRPTSTIRVFYAFDPERDAILLCAGDKSGDKKFYKTMVKIACDEFNAHLLDLKNNSKK